MNNDKKHEGFWYSRYEKHFPKPIPNDQPMIDQDLFLTKLSRKQRSSSRTLYRGISTCRICDKSNGSAEYYNDKWVWPEGYAHYIKEHNVRPSDDFKKFIMGIKKEEHNEPS